MACALDQDGLSHEGAPGRSWGQGQPEEGRMADVRREFQLLAGGEAFVALLGAEDPPTVEDSPEALIEAIDTALGVEATPAARAVLFYVLVRDAGDEHPEWRALYDAWRLVES
jgi:hypothetical protein